MCFKIATKVGIEQDYCYGDFSFIRNSMERKSMEIDLLTINNFHQHAINNLDTSQKITWTTAPQTQEWVEINSSLFQGHTEETYNRNLKNIAFIQKNGWDCFVQSFPLQRKTP